jgi:hypothetical protein
MLLDLVFDHADVLIEQPRIARGVPLGFERELLLELRFGLLAAALLGLFARTFLGRFALALRLLLAFASHTLALGLRLALAALLLGFLGRDAVAFLLLGLLAGAPIGGHSLLLALGRLAPLTLLTLLLRPRLPRRFLARGLLPLDGRLIDDHALNRRRGCHGHARPLDPPREPDDDGRRDCHVQRERPDDGSLVLADEAHSRASAPPFALGAAGIGLEPDLRRAGLL